MEVKLLNKNDKRLKGKCIEEDDFSNMDYYKEVIDIMTKECIRQQKIG